MDTKSHGHYREIFEIRLSHHLYLYLGKRIYVETTYTHALMLNQCGLIRLFILWLSLFYAIFKSFTTFDVY